MKLLITILVTLLVLSMCTYTAKALRFSRGGTTTVLTENKEQIRIWLEGRDKVEMPDDKKKPDLFIRNMVRLNELESSGCGFRDSA